MTARMMLKFDVLRLIRGAREISWNVQLVAGSDASAYPVDPDDVIDFLVWFNDDELMYVEHDEEDGSVYLGRCPGAIYR